jgi:hypothetical protein
MFSQKNFANLDKKNCWFLLKSGEKWADKNSSGSQGSKLLLNCYFVAKG